MDALVWCAASDPLGPAEGLPSEQVSDVGTEYDRLGGEMRR